MLQKLRKYIGNLSRIPAMQLELETALRDLDFIRESIGRIEARQLQNSRSPRLADYEFRVFSQWGDDGIIQYLIRNLNIASKSFIEFGVESYREASTRFLLLHDNWRGLVIDGSQEYMDALRQEEVYWRYDLTAVSSFVTPSNINSLISTHGFAGELGLLSVDIDGMDYWVWKSINVVSPAIVIAEYNSLFGPDRAVTLPLDEKFTRQAAHHSRIYYGVSLAALVKLGEEKGYACVGCNSAGNNVFFVRRDLMPADWKALTAKEAYVAAKFREVRDENGILTFASMPAQQAILEKLPVVEV
jgi:hypothetical protein